MDGVDNSFPQLNKAQQSLMVSFCLHSLLTSAVSPVPIVHAKLDKDILCLWLSGVLHLRELVFTGVSPLLLVVCIHFGHTEIFYSYPGPQVFGVERMYEMLVPVLGGGSPAPFLP